MKFQIDTKYNFVLIFLFLLLQIATYAGTTGKIVGIVIDKMTGEPIPFANIVIVGTDQGTAADEEGKYAILNIAPGEYVVKASSVGYASVTIQEVNVRVDLTTTVNFELVPSSYKTDDVIVVANKNMIIKDQTSQSAIVTSETFTELPVADYQEVISMQAGFTTGGSGEIHARGGRNDEVLYLVDGVPLRNPTDAEFNNTLNKYSIQELQVLTGGFSAEYGQALSGVVNIVTKEGGKKYTGRVEYTSPQINESPYHSPNALALDQIGVDGEGNLVDRVNSEGTELIKDIPSAYKKKSLDDTPALSPDFNLPGELNIVFSGPVPFIDELSFFLTARSDNNLAQTPFGYNKLRDFNGKLTYPLGNIKLSLNSQFTTRLYKPYSHSWKYYPQGYEDRKVDTWRSYLKMNHVLSNSTFYDFSISYNRRNFKRYTPGKTAVFTSDGQLISSNYLRRTNNVPPFWTNADNGIFIDEQVETILTKFDLSSQMNEHNLVKFGLELKMFTIDRLSFQEPYPGGFHGYSDYVKKPIEFSVYAQDKLEFESFIINFGLRFDYTDVDDTRWESVRKPAGSLDSNGIWRPSGEVETDPKTQISPRLGIAFPITDRTVFYSSYGHFFQIPDYTKIYELRDPTLDRALIGNPGISPKKTVAFEFGFKQQIGDDYSLQINAYFKDMTNLVGSTYLTVFPYEYTVFDNSNYGGVQGVEISLYKRLSNYWFARLNYTYSVAKGNESDPREGFNDYRRASAVLRPKRVFLLDFDRTHVFNASFGLSFPEQFGPALGDFYPLGLLDINFIINAYSGLPYTPRPSEESEELIVEKNTARMPAYFKVDLRVSRRFNIGDLSLSLFATVDNLFDNINALDVWDTTGEPWDAGPTSNRTLDRQKDPGDVDQRRDVRVGVRLDF